MFLMSKTVKIMLFSNGVQIGATRGDFATHGFSQPNPI
jgi:hypothetical protein